MPRVFTFLSSIFILTTARVALQSALHAENWDADKARAWLYSNAIVFIILQ
jgi:hypothetical protein